MKKIFFILLFIHCSLYTANALDTLSLKYMPLQVGNFWLYNSIFYVSSSGSSTWVEKLSVFYSRNVNNHIYYYLNSNYHNLFQGYFRVDSTTGSLYAYDSTGSCSNYHNEILIDSLAAVNGDTIKNCGAGSYKCTGISNVFIYGENTFKISFGYTWYNGGIAGGSYSKSFIKNYGFSNNFGSGYSGGNFHWQRDYTLKGCKINGIGYGDTSLTVINQISDIIPGYFMLYQNYPNPFNPTTNVQFTIPNVQFVTLKVFNILGKEVATLVNENLIAGTYEATFDGSQLTSGVYFYKLSAGDYTETKRMLMIK